MKLVICNAPTDQARKIARHLVENRMAACVNILAPNKCLPVGRYRFEESESPLLIKTTDAGLSRLRDARGYTPVRCPRDNRLFNGRHGSCPVPDMADRNVDA